jgi:hypothetical protein
VKFYAIVPKAAEIGAWQIAVDYFERIPAIVDGSCGYIAERVPHPAVNGNGGSYLSIRDYLDHSQEWAELIRASLERIRRAEST